MYICNCNGINERQVKAAIQAGANRWQDVHTYFLQLVITSMEGAWDNKTRDDEENLNTIHAKVTQRVKDVVPLGNCWVKRSHVSPANRQRGQSAENMYVVQPHR